MTVGQISYQEKDRTWKIACEPHVMVRLKRVFERIAKSQHGDVTLGDTPENARELEWFIARYPMEVADPEYLTQRANAHREREAMIHRTLDLNYEPTQFELAIPARDYQRRAADLLLKSGGLLLADDVGIGKTVSAICAFTDTRTLPAVVVTLTHLPSQWKSELAKFAPKLKTHIIQTGKLYDIRAKDGSFPDVILINYHKLNTWADTLVSTFRVKSLILDECQELRHGSSNKYSAARHISENCSYRGGLSATPFYNYGAEMFNVMEILQPGCLGTPAEFSREWCGGNIHYQEKVSIKDPRAFGMYLREQGLMLRRTRKEVGRELPPLTKAIHTIDADLDEIQKISSSATELAKIILAQKGFTEKGQKFLAAEEFSVRLRQATGIAKAAYVAEFVKILAESGEKIVLYGWHRDVYAIWKEKLRDLNPVFYTGSESTTQKEASKKAFIEGDARVLIMSLRAGAGLDGLQGHCSLVVFGEIDYSPGVHEQAIGRVYRDGQEDSVTAYFLISESGSDPIIADILGLKASQIQGVKDPTADIIENLDVGGRDIKRLAESFLKQVGTYDKVMADLATMKPLKNTP